MRSELILWKPFEGFLPLHREVDDLFSHFFGDWEWSLPKGTWSGGWFPPVESYLEGDKLIAKVDLPGVDPKDVEISVADNQLTIKGERKTAREHNGNKNNYLYREVRYGRFERKLPLLKGVSADNVSARYHDGVLEISMPTPKNMAARRIPIEAK
jgi:HSP20 family protein